MVDWFADGRGGTRHVGTTEIAAVAAQRTRPAATGTTPARTRRRAPAWVWTWAPAVCFAVLYTLLAVRRHQQQQTAGYDLGIFEQTVRAYAHLQAPMVPLKGTGFDELGDHFSPVLVLLAPLYRVFPSPVTLLVAQSVLLALAIVPLAGWALRVRGPVAALVVGGGVGVSWGIVQAADFDFHEIAFAVPLIAYAVCALGERRWRAAALWALPLLLVKEDQGLTVAAVGVFVALRGPRRLGLWLTAAGALGTCAEVLLVLPSFNAHGGFDYWQQITGGGTDTTGGITQAGGDGSLLGLLLHLPWPGVKWATLLLLLAPTAFLALRSPLVLLCAPTLLWRFASGNAHYWGFHYHYSAVLMPIVFGAFVDALDRGGVPPRVLRGGLAFSAAFSLVTLPCFPLWDLTHRGEWTTSAHVRDADRLLQRIPSGTTVGAGNRLAAQLVSRDTVGLVCLDAAQGVTPQWVVVDAKDSKAVAPCSASAAIAALHGYETRGYRVVGSDDGVTLLRR
ncbi:DUF2079 domain-containing protein [Streptacidiphilus sp. NEAU-YB345]|uniref:DUF2079 domain-containing protein n=1 Tax=Streptacidiphilus fuscans TaxID=2789292 RepID=A0A931B662_9ACTN|nr:DUF2079 domain-containing protein [Streptacidiphilus fuscans]